MVPQFVIVAGPNGCGKSSAASELVKKRLGIVPIDPDGILREYRARGATPGGDALNLAAVLEAERRVWKAIARGESVAVETVLSTDKYLDAVDTAIAHGFETTLYFATVESADVAVARVRERVRAGGHAVPEAKIRARWGRTNRSCAILFRKVHHAIAFDNSMAAPRWLAGAHDGFVVWDDAAKGLAKDLRAEFKLQGLVP
jgi:predicted ABC-type ATPase